MTLKLNEPAGSSRKSKAPSSSVVTTQRPPLVSGTVADRPSRRARSGRPHQSHDRASDRRAVVGCDDAPVDARRAGRMLVRCGCRGWRVTLLRPRRGARCGGRQSRRGLPYATWRGHYGFLATLLYESLGACWVKRRAPGWLRPRRAPPSARARSDAGASSTRLHASIVAPVVITSSTTTTTRSRRGEPRRRARSIHVTLMP